MGVIKGKRQRLLFFSITALGISSIITQIIAIREFFGVFYGNELVFGIILANWLLLTGIGAYLGKYMKKGKISWLIISQLLISVLPFFHIIVIRELRNTIFLSGELIGIVEIFFSSLFILMPYCLVSGFLLTLACHLYSLKKDSSAIGKVYFMDSIGDILGGILFSFVFVYLLNVFQIVFFLFVVNIIASMALAFFIKKKMMVVAIFLLAFVVLAGFFSFDLNKVSRERQYIGQELVFQRDTPYGNLVVTKTLDQYNFYENGITLFTTEDVIRNEETVHYAMVQVENASRVLLISGGVSGTIDEILKYNVSLDYVELDQLIVELGRRYTKNLDDPRVRIINMDGRLFVRNTKDRYDAVIVDLPDPSTAQLNRFYTVEFFKEIKRILKKNGIFSLSMSGGVNYLGAEVRKLNSVLYNSLSEHFGKVIVIPGERNIFIASESGLSYNIAGLIEDKGIETSYVNGFYLKGRLTNDRINYVKKSLDPGAEVNKDFNPISYYYHLLYWVRHFRLDSTLFFITLIGLLVFYLSRLKAISFAVFSSGFAASSLEVVILIGFQVLYGYAYHQIAIIITAFMMGLATGSYYMNRRLEDMGKKELVNIEYSISFYSIMLPFVFIFLSKAGNVVLVYFLSRLIMPLFTFLIAALVGMEFPLASKLSFKGKIGETAGRLYNADLIGAAIGALLVSSLLIPLIGIFKVCFLVGILNLIGGLIVKSKTLYR